MKKLDSVLTENPIEIRKVVQNTLKRTNDGIQLYELKKKSFF